MKASWEKTEKNRGVLTVETDIESVANALDQAFKKVVKQVNVPGFRKGKVPRPIFERRFGVEALYQDAVDILLPKAYEEAIDETGIVPVDQPEIDIEQIEKGKAFIFQATVTVKPEVTLGEYKNLEVPEKDFSVSDEDVEKDLEKMQKQQGELVAIEEGAVENSDRIIFDFEGFIDGETFEGGSAERYNLEIGSGTFIPGFEEQLIGLEIGGERDVNVVFPEDYNAANLAGKEALFKVKLHEIKRLELPELDDEFAQDVSEFDTLGELKVDIRNRLEENAKKQQEEYTRNELVQVASENAEVEIPQVMIDNEADQRLHQFEHQLSYQGMNLDIYTQFTGQSRDDLKKQFIEEAEKQVRSNLVLEAIGKAEKIEVSEQEIEDEIDRMAKEMSREVDEIKKLLEAQGGTEPLKEQLLIKKTIDLLVLSSKNTA
ncbi:trigger factor [Seinonella peptonophila]|uniref:Trigger factor n=1 Tax=Seinonella peptonophila TaxID=112248 RepID=A0A1M4TVU7_9BACL|nr:trigger factor [Seinonella peptonophila]SHE48437.1 trigger factor [Seinonella peptonophila]